jgi:hypothetical protein
LHSVTLSKDKGFTLTLLRPGAMCFKKKIIAVAGKWLHHFRILVNFFKLKACPNLITSLSIKNAIFDIRSLFKKKIQ